MRVLALGLLLACAGCYLSHERAGPDAGRDAGRDGRPRDAGRDAARDAPPPEDVRTDGRRRDCDASVVPDPEGPELAVDLLFVVDDSGSMSEEQAALAAQFPRMVRILATGDLDEDGRAEFQPVQDLQVGVVSTNLGAGAAELGGCIVEATEGDDGILRTTSNRLTRRTTGCAATYPRWLSFRPAEGGSSEAFVRDFACVAAIGTQGCGFEQPLEAALKAVVPAASGLPVATGGLHGDTENAGFVREGSILALVLVTDENDCSVRDPEIFARVSERYPVDGDDISERCFLYPEALWPPSRYVDAFRSLRADEPEALLIAAIAGVPVDLVVDPDAIDYDALLTDPRMQEVIDPDRPDRHLRPACDVKGTGFAVPGRRLVEVVREFGDQGVVQSICDDDLPRALRGITSQLGRVIARRRCTD